MADKKISELITTTTVGDADLITTVQSGVNKKITGLNFKQAVSSPVTYTNTIFVAGTYGLDTNSGLSPSLAIKTIEYAESITTSGSVIKIIENGTYTIADDFTLTHDLIAPGIILGVAITKTLNVTGCDAFVGTVDAAGTIKGTNATLFSDKYKANLTTAGLGTFFGYVKGEYDSNYIATDDPLSKVEFSVGVKVSGATAPNTGKALVIEVDDWSELSRQYATQMNQPVNIGDSPIFNKPRSSNSAVNADELIRKDQLDAVDDSIPVERVGTNIQPKVAGDNINLLSGDYVDNNNNFTKCNARQSSIATGSRSALLATNEAIDATNAFHMIFITGGSNGDTITIDPKTGAIVLTAGGEFTIGATDSDTAISLAGAVNSTFPGVIFASPNVPATGYVYLTHLVAGGAGNQALVSTSNPAAFQLSADHFIGGGATHIDIPEVCGKWTNSGIEAGDNFVSKEFKTLKEDGIKLNLLQSQIATYLTIEFDSFGDVQYYTVIPEASVISLVFSVGEVIATVPDTLPSDFYNQYFDDNLFIISGADQPEYNGVWRGTKIGSGQIKFVIPNNPTSPATGTIKIRGLSAWTQSAINPRLDPTLYRRIGYIGVIVHVLNIAVEELGDLGSTSSDNLPASVLDISLAIENLNDRGTVVSDGGAGLKLKRTTAFTNQIEVNPMDRLNPNYLSVADWLIVKADVSFRADPAGTAFTHGRLTAIGGIDFDPTIYDNGNPSTPLFGGINARPSGSVIANKWSLRYVYNNLVTGFYGMQYGQINGISDADAADKNFIRNSYLTLIKDPSVPQNLFIGVIAMRQNTSNFGNNPAEYIFHRADELGLTGAGLTGGSYTPKALSNVIHFNPAGANGASGLNDDNSVLDEATAILRAGTPTAGDRVTLFSKDGGDFSTTALTLKSNTDIEAIGRSLTLSSTLTLSGSNSVRYRQLSANVTVLGISNFIQTDASDISDVSLSSGSNVAFYLNANSPAMTLASSGGIGYAYIHGGVYNGFDFTLNIDAKVNILGCTSELRVGGACTASGRIGYVHNNGAVALNISTTGNFNSLEIGEVDGDITGLNNATGLIIVKNHLAGSLPAVSTMNTDMILIVENDANGNYQRLQNANGVLEVKNAAGATKLSVDTANNRVDFNNMQTVNISLLTATEATIPIIEKMGSKQFSLTTQPAAVTLGDYTFGRIIIGKPEMNGHKTVNLSSLSVGDGYHNTIVNADDIYNIIIQDNGNTLIYNGVSVASVTIAPGEFGKLIKENGSTRYFFSK